MPGAPDHSPEALPGFQARPDLFRIICLLAAAFAVALLGWILLEIVESAAPAIAEFGPGFLVDSSWVPNRGQFGVLPFVIGTIASSAIAILLALPLGLAVAVFLSENFLAPPLRQTIRFVVEMLAAIPSVVYGLWGIFVVIPLAKSLGDWFSTHLGGIPLFAGPAYGNSLFTASAVLAIMILPTITAISRNALAAVPAPLREGSYALGATRWEAILGVIIPAAAPGIVAATILALGRAMGETMAVAMLIGNSSRLSWSIFSPSGTLAGLLANQFGEASGLQVHSLMYAALVLVLITLAVNIAGEVVLRHARRSTSGIH